MSTDHDAAALREENAALRKTVAVLTKRLDGLLDSSSNTFDAFAQSVLLEQIVQRRTSELEEITADARRESEQRRAAEDSMRRERRLLENVLSNLPHLVSWKDDSFVIRGCNTLFARSCGKDTRDNVIGLKENDLDWRLADPGKRRERERRVMESGVSEHDCEEKCVTSDGRERVFLTSTVAMRDSDGEITGILSISADISDRKMLEMQLVQAQKLESIGQLASGIAHEINTPAQYVGDNTRFVQQEFHNLLSVIDAYERMLSADGESISWAERSERIKNELKSLDYEFLREEVPKALEQSVEGVNRISQIVTAMKEFSHPGANNKSLVDLNKAIESTVMVCTNRWKYVADLELKLDPDLPSTACLVGEFNQVILNLVVNAADAIESRFEGKDKKGRITVSSRRDDDCVVIEVSDNGGGVPESIRDKIFDPFFTTKEVGKGTGQGLAISQDVIVQKLGGSLQCRVKEGVGSTFTIRIPIHDAVREPAAA